MTPKKTTSTPEQTDKKPSSHRSKRSHSSKKNTKKTTPSSSNTPQKKQDASSTKNQKKSSSRSHQRRQHNKHNNRHRSKDRPKKFTNRISDHFSKKDFTCAESGTFKISLGLVGALEHLRSTCRKRITIVKGFESLEVAEKKGSFKRNLHTQGLAADIQIDGLSAEETFLLAETIPEFTGIGLNKKENYVHVDTRKSDERLCWIEENQQETPLTEALRKKHLPTKSPSTDDADTSD